MNWNKVIKRGLIGGGVAALAAVGVIPIIGGFGMVAMGTGIGTGLVTGVITLIGGVAGAGSETIEQLGEEEKQLGQENA